MSKDSFIGIDIGGTKISAVRVQNNEIVSRSKNDTGADRSAEEIVLSIADTIREIFTDDVKAIGIGVPGILDVEKGIIIGINNIPSFKDFNLKDALEEIFPIPIFINNDANCFVLSEAYFGAGKDYNNIAGITLGTGTGGGVIINRKIHSGKLGAAAEFGILPYLDGIIEHYCSNEFFEKKFNFTGLEAFKLAEEGDERALEAFKQFSFHLGQLVTMITYFMAPDAIIIGGSISKSFKYFKPGLDKMIQEFRFPVIGKNINILRAESKDTGELGAVALAISMMQDS